MTRIKWAATSLAMTLSLPILTGGGAQKTITLNFVQAHNTKTETKLPAGTHSVAFAVPGGSLYCASVQLTWSDGDHSTVFLDSSLPTKSHMKQATGPRNGAKTYTAVTVDCRAEAGTGRLVMVAAPSQ